jgi:uncharacterized YigZ family protein
VFQTIKSCVEAEITEKKSKFICHAYHVESVDEAEEILRNLRKEYHDARHNCFAYRVIKDDVSRASDDGEPSGTAGMPMLNILNGRNLSNILVVVTRYFGGILLGTGGLVRAYSLATTLALDSASIVTQTCGLEARFFIGYRDLEELKYILKNRGIVITRMDYGEKIDVVVEAEEDKIRKMQNEKISDRFVLDKFEILCEKYIYLAE